MFEDRISRRHRIRTKNRTPVTCNYAPHSPRVIFQCHAFFPQWCWGGGEQGKYGRGVGRKDGAQNVGLKRYVFAIVLGFMKQWRYYEILCKTGLMTSANSISQGEREKVKFFMTGNFSKQLPIERILREAGQERVESTATMLLIIDFTMSVGNANLLKQD